MSKGLSTYSIFSCMQAKVVEKTW